MKQIDKKASARLVATCKRIRELLHLEHRRASYEIVEERGDRGQAASCYMFDEGSQILIRLFPEFWTCDGEMQLRILIHEHIHAATMPVTQAYNACCQLVHSSEVMAFNRAFILADEQVTCHLESVIFDLVAERF